MTSQEEKSVSPGTTGLICISVAEFLFFHFLSF